MSLKHSLGWSNSLLDRLHTVIVEHLQDNFGELLQVDAYPKPGENLSLPAGLVELEELKPTADQPGGDQDVLDAWIVVRLVFDPNEKGAAVAMRQLAAEMGISLRRMCRPIPGHGQIRLRRVGDDQFRPDLDGYLVWCVEVSVALRFGCEEPEGQTPELWVSQSPEIGEVDPKHIEDYVLAE